jgi:fatty acid elongase 3
MVHVFMYYYYFRAAGGARLWWKKYITTLQITQFVIDLFFVYFCSYTYFTATYWDWMPNYGSCAGSESAAIFGCLILSSYLLLFIGFYNKTYNSKKGVTASKGKAQAKVE